MWPRLKDDANVEHPRRAGVSSFGFGGVNAHVVLEEYPGGAGRRASLPARTFADTRFWIPEETEACYRQAMNSCSTCRSGVSCMSVRRCRWRRRGVSFSRVVSKLMPLSGHRVIVCDRGEGDIGARYIAAAGAVLNAIQSELRVGDPQPVLLQTRASARRRGGAIRGSRRDARYRFGGGTALHRPGRRRGRWAFAFQSGRAPRRGSALSSASACASRTESPSRVGMGRACTVQLFCARMA